jgi:hypothetical protein
MDQNTKNGQTPETRQPSVAELINIGQRSFPTLVANYTKAVQEHRKQATAPADSGNAGQCPRKSPWSFR